MRARVRVRVRARVRVRVRAGVRARVRVSVKEGGQRSGLGLGLGFGLGPSARPAREQGVLLTTYYLLLTVLHESRACGQQQRRVDGRDAHLVRGYGWG